MNRNLSHELSIESDERNLIDSKRSSNISSVSALQHQDSDATTADVLSKGSRSSSLSSVFSTDSKYVGLDPVPRYEHYSREDSHVSIKRPPLDVLHHPRRSTYRKWSEKISRDSVESDNADEYKFGWITGVFVPTFINLLGSAVFIRMGWITGQVGIVLALVQVLIGLFILSITVLSMTALCTNGQVGGGGMYYMIARNLGPASGAMYAIVFFITNSIMVAFSIVGTCEGVQSILETYNIGIVEYPTSYNDVRIIGAVCLAIVATIPFISLELETKTQWFLFWIIMIAIVDFLIGSFIPPTNFQKVNGYEGWKMEIFLNNLWPKYDGETFFTVFSVYASSIAGDFTGASMSSTLKDAGPAIFKGSLLAVLTSSLLYVVLIVFLGSTILSYATGNLGDLKFNNYTCTSNVDGNCQSGLINQHDTMSLSAALTQTGIIVEPLIMAGLFAQTLSSAMCSYIAAPQIFQALAADNILPYIGWFAKGYGPLNDPRRGYVLVAIIALCFIAIANFNSIAAVMTNCYLASWGLICLSCFLASLGDSPSFRPSFKYFNKWVCLLSGVTCATLMFLCDWLSAIILVAIMFVIWLYLFIMKPDVNWGSIGDSNLFVIAHSSVSKLSLVNDHVKNYRPSVLLLCGDPKVNLNLARFANEMTKNSGMLIVADIRTSTISYDERCDTIKKNLSFLQSNKIKCFYNLIESNAINDGANMLIQCAGLGKLKPNIIMMGYFKKWRNCSDKELLDYFNIIHYSLGMHQTLVIYRDLNEKKDSESDNDNSISYINVAFTQPDFEPSFITAPFDEPIKNSRSLSRLSNPEIVTNETNKNKFIDIWWLYDDGGMTILLPYLISQRKKWKKCKLRVFTLTKNDEIDSLKDNLSKLLEKFRIPYSDLFVLDEHELPHDKSILKFNGLIRKWIVNLDYKSQDSSKLKLTESDLERFKSKTNKYIRMAELLQENSKDSTLIVMTLPIPRENYCPAPLYMSWLETLSADMPPSLLIRGNQTNVLTFYCE